MRSFGPDEARRRPQALCTADVKPEECVSVLRRERLKIVFEARTTLCFRGTGAAWRRPRTKISRANYVVSKPMIQSVFHLSFERKIRNQLCVINFRNCRSATAGQECVSVSRGGALEECQCCSLVRVSLWPPSGRWTLMVAIHSSREQNKGTHKRSPVE